MPDNFLDTLKGNIGQLARGYLFYVTIEDAPAAEGQYSKYLVRSASLPEASIDAIEVPWQGMTYKVGSTHTFSEWSCTFNVDKNLSIYRWFEDWMKKIHDPRTNAQGNPSNYFGQISIELLPSDADFTTDVEPIYTMRLYQAWPSSLGAADLAYDSKEILQFDVTFTYGWHKKVE